jgi:hypothetical protein
MTRRFTDVTFALLAMAAGGSASAQQTGLTASISYSGTVDCDQPRRIRNFPISGQGTATIFQDRRASMDLTIKGTTSNRLRFDATLGGRPASAPGGMATLRVVSSNQLRMTWDLPNNLLIVDLRVSPGACTMTVDNKLKGGALKYSMFDGGAFYFCDRPKITNHTCTMR